MSERMTIHRGLAELKVLDSRISNAINSGIYCVANKRSNTTIAGESIDNFKKVMVGDFDKVVDLIARRNSIKSAIIASNAVTEVDVAGEVMTVANAIERKSSIRYDNDFLGTLRSHFRKADGTVKTENDQLQKKLEIYLNSILGNKEHAKPEDVEIHTKLFMANNTFDLIDPNQLRKRIEALTDKISNFMAEIDAVLSESNAVTFIEI